jgi:hypothetical protein
MNGETPVIYFVGGVGVGGGFDPVTHSDSAGWILLSGSKFLTRSKVPFSLPSKSSSMIAIGFTSVWYIVM